MKGLYLVRYGDKVKVGISYDLIGRIRTHSLRAYHAGLAFAELFTLPPHPEARDNERAVVERFSRPGSRSEYLDADPDEVIAFIRTLPCTPLPERERIRETAQRIPRAEAARMLGVSEQVLDRYARTGQLPPYRNQITKRVHYRVEDVQAFRELIAS